MPGSRPRICNVYVLYGANGGELSAEESDLLQPEKCVMATEAVWKMFVGEMLQDSLCWMWEWMNSPSLVPSACRNLGSRSWNLTLNVCAQLSFRHGGFADWLWKNSFLQFSLKNGLLLPSCHAIIYWLGALNWGVGYLHAAHCTASNGHLPSAGKVPLLLTDMVIWNWDYWVPKIVSTAPKTVSDVDTALIFRKEKRESLNSPGKSIPLAWALP